MRHSNRITLSEIIRTRHILFALDPDGNTVLCEPLKQGISLAWGHTSGRHDIVITERVIIHCDPRDYYTVAWDLQAIHALIEETKNGLPPQSVHPDSETLS